MSLRRKHFACSSRTKKFNVFDFLGKNLCLDASLLKQILVKTLTGIMDVIKASPMDAGILADIC